MADTTMTVAEALEGAYDTLDGIYGGDGVTETGAAMLERAMALILRVINDEVEEV